MKIYMYIVWNCCLTFVKTSLLPSKNDDFHENAHFLLKNYPFYKKNSILHTYKKTQTSNMSFYKKNPFLEIIETPEVSN